MRPMSDIKLVYISYILLFVCFYTVLYDYITAYLCMHIYIYIYTSLLTVRLISNENEYSLVWHDDDRSVGSGELNVLFGTFALRSFIYHRRRIAYTQVNLLWKEFCRYVSRAGQIASARHCVLLKSCWYVRSLETSRQ